MSCGSVKHQFEEHMKNGVDFQKAMDIFQEVEGSIAAHRTELQELQKMSGSQGEIDHLKEHIKEGEDLLQRIKGMKLH